MSSRPETSRRRVPIIGSQIAFALGACGGAGEYLRAREQVRSLYARPGERPDGEEFRVDVVYADGCPGSPSPRAGCQGIREPPRTATPLRQ